MAVKEISKASSVEDLRAASVSGVVVSDAVKEYQALSTDLETSYPRNCGAGSCMEIIDVATKKVVAYKVFNGSIWADL